MDSIAFIAALEPLREARAFAAWLAPTAHAEWVVYAKPPFGGARQVLDYLGRYTHRVAISNHRLQTFDGDAVTFQWKDYKHGAAIRTMTLAADEFTVAAARAARRLQAHPQLRPAGQSPPRNQACHLSPASRRRCPCGRDVPRRGRLP